MGRGICQVAIIRLPWRIMAPEFGHCPNSTCPPMARMPQADSLKIAASLPPPCGRNPVWRAEGLGQVRGDIYEVRL
jgi:hypothetical protein